MKQTIWTLALILFTAYSLTGCGSILTPLPPAPTEPPVTPSTSAPTAVPSETSKPSDTPSPIPISETVAPSEIPQITPPTNTPEPPSIKITYPLDNRTLRCDERAKNSSCLFHVEGIVKGTDSALVSNYIVYVLVYPLNPPGEGWYLQKSPAPVEADGKWKQSPAYLGNNTYPAAAGNTLRIQAVLVTTDATFNGKMLVDLVTEPGEIILPIVTAIKDIVAISDITDVELVE